MEKNIGFEHFLLSEYHKRGIFSRTKIIQLFRTTIQNQLKIVDKLTKEPEFGLSTNQLISTLQIGLVSQLMMFIEDVAVLCWSFLENKNYYQYLDKESQDEDLGNIIGMFFSKIDSLSDDDLKEILQYLDPQNYEFESDEEKSLLISAMEKNYSSTRKFLKKLEVFRDNHIGIFRRYKHASFPFLMGVEIPVGDVDYKKFDFTTFTPISHKDPTKIMLSMPFSQDVLISYENLNMDIFLFLTAVVNNRLIVIERNAKGVPPSHMDHFSRKFSTPELDILKKLWKRYEISHPKLEGEFRSTAKMSTAYTFWYVHLDEYLKSSFDLLENG